MTTQTHGFTYADITRMSQRIVELEQTVATLRVREAALEQRIAEQAAELERFQQFEHARKRTNEALHTIEARYKWAIQAGKVGVWDWNLQTNEIYLAPNLKAMLGYNDHEIHNSMSDWIRYVHPDDMETVMAAAEAHLQGTMPVFEVEYRMLHRDRSVRWFIGRGTVIRDEHGTPLRMAGANTDITEQKQAEEDLRHSQHLLVNTFASMREAVFIIDADTVKIVDCNPAASEIFGHSRQEMLGYTTSFLHSNSDAVAEFKEHLLQSVKQMGNVRFPARTMKRKDGAILHTEHSVMPLEDGQGRRVGWVNVVRDITERIQAEEALRSSEQRFRAIFAHAGIGIALASMEKQITDSNPAFQRFLGYTAQELHYISIRAMTHPDDIKPELAMYQELLEGKRTSYQMEKRYIRKDGEIIWGYVTVSLLYDETQTPQLVIGMVEDISERKRAEAALRDSEARYRTLVETSPSAILLTDLDSTIRFCNQQAVELFGYTSREELCNKTGADLVATEQPFDPLTSMPIIERSGNIRNIEYALCRHDGTTFSAEVSSAVIRDANDNPTALIIIVHDMSERKQAEQALSAAYGDLESLNRRLTHSRDLLRAVFDGLDHGLVLIDKHGSVQMINKTLATLLGSIPSALVGQSWEALYQRFVPFETEHVVSHLPWDDGINQQRVRYLCPDGITRIFNIQKIAPLSSYHTVDQVIVQVVDVTRQVQLQARVIENERFAASGRLAASVAHEINTPLQSLELFLELARGASTSTEREQFLAYIREEMQRVGRIVGQVLDLYRPGASTNGILDFHLLIERLLLLLGKRFKEQSVVVERSIAPDVPTLSVRADEFMQVLLNIMVNALDVMPCGGTLGIQADLSPDQPIPTSQNVVLDNCSTSSQPTATNDKDLVIAISDTGSGISPEIQPHIFEAFVTTKEHGTGIGLAISKQIVQQYGGCITVESQPGIGSTFTILIPIAQHNRDKKRQPQVG